MFKVKIDIALISIFTMLSCNLLLRGPEQDAKHDDFYIHKTFYTGDTLTESNNISFSIPKNKQKQFILIKIIYTEMDKSLPTSIDLKINNQYYKNIPFMKKKRNLIRDLYVCKIELETNLISQTIFQKIENVDFYIQNNNIQKTISLNKEDLNTLNQILQNTSD
ncbi:hypothetical protein EHQ91_02265 [Leptospira biflexa]|uniref:hypothetical protein n=1 Tax=Leptospira biflexa TaxID=172 RepID=UPI0010915482|nr:hypothetical protein [Leptospira biflexa]TGM57692.1 hypothetical protein EHQ91_02265 [Leptospira biflexa]